MLRAHFVFFVISTLSLYGQETLKDRSALEIVQQAVINKKHNNPSQALAHYKYTSYEKTVITDSLLSGLHSYYSEKVSNAIYSKEYGFTENVLGFELAGFSEIQYQVLAVNLQSRSFYDSDFVIFNTRYAGILSKRGLKNYNYVTLIQNDSTIRIAFSPKRPRAIPGLKGYMDLEPKSLAITHVNVALHDKIDLEINQTYTYHKASNLYFPENRNLILDKGESQRNFSFFGGKLSIGTLQSGDMDNVQAKKYLVSVTKNSLFSLKAKEKKSSQFAIIIDDEAISKPPDFWKNYRLEAPSQKDKRSFSAIEDIVQAENIERLLGTINNFSVGYYSVNFFDFDLTYPVKFNNFEGLRLGLGGVTNAGFSERFRLEGYGAYGFKDKAFKYGIGGGYLVNPDKNFWISLTYNSDLEEVGNFAFLTDRRVYSLFEPRLVNINLFYAHRTARTNFEYRIAPKLLSELQIAHRRIDQTTPYRFLIDGTEISNYNITEASLGMRWSPGSKFMKTPENVSEVYDGYPKISGQISQGLSSLGGDFNFTKLGAKAFYRVDRLNKTVTEILIEGNIGFGDLPITHLFHAFPNAPTKETILQRFSVAGVNSFETMFFSEFFSDQLFTAQLKHRLKPFNLGRKFKPEMVLISRFAIGDIRNPEDHLDISFGSLDQGFTESGFEINKLFWGFGTSFTYRYGAYHLPNFEDNIAFKFTFNLKL